MTDEMRSHDDVTVRHINDPYGTQVTCGEMTVSFAGRNDAAAAHIGMLLQKVQELRQSRREILEILRDLHDLQNGPPLAKYKDAWRLCMDEAKRLLREHSA